MKSIVIIALTGLVALGSMLQAHDIADLKMDQMDYLYARHDDDRLMKIACAKALTNNAKGAFYVGALFSEPDSIYFEPRTGLLWLTIAEQLGYNLAQSFIEISFPNLSQTERNRNIQYVVECTNSAYQECHIEDTNTYSEGLGWPPQTQFKCEKSN